MKLKDIIDAHGWGEMQGNQLPPEIVPKPGRYDNSREHDINIYGLNGVCVITVDDTEIVELCGVAKRPDGSFERRAALPVNTAVAVQGPGYMDGFPLLNHFWNKFVYVREMEADFQGIGRRMERAGQLYSE